MRYLFSARSEIEKKLRWARHVLLCADFDGTIVPIKPRPKEVRLCKDRRLLLDKISRLKSFSVGIISGRALKDIKEKVGIKGIIYAGNHGLEISYKKRNFIYPAAKTSIPIIRKIARQLAKALSFFPGVVLEEKGLTLSLHYRLVKRADLAALKKVFFQIVKPYLDSKKAKLTYGKKVWEVRPPIEWDKGKALLWLLGRIKHKKTFTIYIGDDLTDEDAFRAVEKIGGVGILVGRKKASSAKYYFKNTKDTQKFLEEIYKEKCGK
ncbi:MAG: trehalose-phosphatase [Candidatus Omnitrophica bacterium]|nr:trehalose-phosphatase [Candidatus Omnitrophota bacterium]